MLLKTVSELKEGDSFWANCSRETVNYNTWAKIVRIEDIRTYNSTNPGKQQVIRKIYYKPAKGPLAGNELDCLVEDFKKVTIPPKPSKFRQIMNILFT